MSERERFRSTLDNMLEGCQIIDFNWRYVYVNDTVVRHGKQTRENMLGRTMMEVFPGIESTELFGFLRIGMEERRAHHLENEFTFPDGSEGWFVLSILPMPEGIFVLSLDITERKRMEAALRQSEEKYKLLVENANEVILVVQDGLFKFANNKVVELLGYSPRELIGQPVVDHIHPEERAVIAERQRKRLKGEPVTHIYDSRVMDRAGRTKWVRINNVIIEWEERTATLNLLSDISDYKQALEALEASERRYRVIFEGTAQGILVADAEERKFLYANKAICRMSGYTAEELLHLGVKDIHPRKSLPRALEIFRGLARGEDYWIPILPFICKDGRELQVEIHSAPVVMDGRDCLVGFFTDVTERIRLEEEMSDLETQLRQSQKMEAIGRLAGGVAHDFNNILTIIIGYAEMMLLEIDPDNKLRREVEEIKKAGERAGALTHQLLAFSRKQILAPRVINLNENISAVHKMLARLIGEDIALEIKLAPDLDNILVDIGQMEQVIMNLVVNARDAMPFGGLLSIETSNVVLSRDYIEKHPLAAPGRYVQLTVTDTGLGMDDETRDHIFEPFYTTKDEAKGTGLGLATVYGIVQQSGGHVLVYSEPGQGTSFKVYLPARDADVEAVPDYPVDIENYVGRGRILVVEDEEMVRDLTEKLLVRYGFETMVASSAEEALMLLGGTGPDPDLVLTDVVMPGMNGPEMVKIIREQRPGLKVIYMSGYTEHASIRSGLLEFQGSFLQKPFNPPALLDIIRRTLEE